MIQLYVVLAGIHCAGYSASVLIEGAENWVIFDLLNVSIPQSTSLSKYPTLRIPYHDSMNNPSLSHSLFLSFTLTTFLVVVFLTNKSFGILSTSTYDLCESNSRRVHSGVTRCSTYSSLAFFSSHTHNTPNKMCIHICKILGTPLKAKET